MSQLINEPEEDDKLDDYVSEQRLNENGYLIYNQATKSYQQKGTIFPAVESGIMDQDELNHIISELNKMRKETTPLTRILMMYSIKFSVVFLICLLIIIIVLKLPYPLWIFFGSMISSTLNIKMILHVNKHRDLDISVSKMKKSISLFFSKRNYQSRGMKWNLAHSPNELSCEVELTQQNNIENDIIAEDKGPRDIEEQAKDIELWKTYKALNVHVLKSSLAEDQKADDANPEKKNFTEGSNNKTTTLIDLN